MEMDVIPRVDDVQVLRFLYVRKILLLHIGPTYPVVPVIVLMMIEPLLVVTRSSVQDSLCGTSPSIPCHLFFPIPFPVIPSHVPEFRSSSQVPYPSSRSLIDQFTCLSFTRIPCSFYSYSCPRQGTCHYTLTQLNLLS